MSYTLFQATLDLARTLMNVWESAATGGSTTTVVDSSIFQPSNYFSDDGHGTLWLKLATAASKVITGHTTTTLTFTPAQAGAVAAGNLYAAAPGTFPKWVLIQAINAAITEIGLLPYQKQVTAVADQESYTSSDDVVFAEHIIGVELANNSAAPYSWTQHGRWRQEITGSPPALTLIFDESAIPANAYPMQIHYLAAHAEIKADSDTIHTAIAPERLRWEAAVHALRWRYQAVKQDDPTHIALLNEAQQQVAIMRLKYPTTKTRSPRYTRW